ncbi:MAG: NADH-quinone oxidoreductase subunit J [Desulfovibrio sp.]|uniref:NADH-quinone oxidoreductase subunit J family protein n=1 Tax=Desulfovibrio sp. 7SRBS1 TaxID=3378064 RepID=UPI003B404A3E
MEFAAKFLFVFYTIVIAVGGLAAALSSSLVRALVGLILTLFGVSGMYLLLNAPFVALMQLLIYVGAVVILIFFAIMLTRAPAGGEERKDRPIRKYLFALMGAVAPAFAFGWVIMTMAPTSSDKPDSVSAIQLGQGLMEPYILAFELISVVLLVAMSAAVLLAFKRRKSE